jgi:uncharacterized phiE125 gp8 family phage protein
MGLRLITPAAAYPVVVADAKIHASVDADVTAFDNQFTSLWIPSATSAAQHATGRALITQTWMQTRDGFPCHAIALPYPPLQEVEFIKYLDADGVPQTLDPADYQVVTDELVGYVIPAYNGSWPAARCVPGSVQVQFIAGYGDEPEDVPADIRNWMYMAIATWFKQRESVITGTIVAELPEDFCAGLLDNYRVNFL